MLAEVLDDPSPLVRKDAVAALGRIAGPSAENLIVMALRDEDPSIRVEAASTLGDRRDKGLGAVPEDTVCARLADLLLDESADVRVVTASVLQSLTRYDFAGVDWRDGEAVWREAAAEKFADWLSRGRPSGE